MKRVDLRSNWQWLAALGLAICLLALLLHPVPAHDALLAAFVLFPVVFLGLVLVPQSLWPVSDLELRFVAPILCLANLFQRPPPSLKS